MATIQNVSTAGAGNQVVGKVVILYGTVKAISADGTVRLLMPNSPIFANDQIITESDGRVSIMFDGAPPSQMDLGRMSTVVIDEDVYAGPTSTPVSDVTADLEEIQKALLAGDEPIELEPAAAGGSNAAGGGRKLFVVDPTGEEVTPTSGAETIGVTYSALSTVEGSFNQPGTPDANNPPDAVNDLAAANDALVTPEDTPLTIAAATLTANDSDPEGDAFSITGFTQTSNGSLVQNPDGSFTYTPNADYNGPDSFTYTITDAKGATDTATVTIDVTPVNDPPDAVNDVFAENDALVTPEDTPLTIAAAALTANDSDPEGDAFSITGFTQTSNGSLVQNPDGSFTYTPNADYNGPDSFTYTITDAKGATDTATVTIDVTPVNDPPDAVNDVFAGNDALVTPEDTPLTIAAAALTANDSDPEGDAFSITGFTQTSNGLLVQNPDGSFTYTPNADYNGPDSFTYTITDANGATDTATVTIDVTPVIDSFTDGNEVVSTPEDTPISGNVIDGSSVDGPLSVTTFQIAGDAATYNAGDTATIAGVGTLTIASGGAYTFTPALNYNGPVPVATYTLTDGSAPVDTSTLTISVTPVNDPLSIDAVKHVFMPDATSEMVGDYANGYALKIGAPTDVDGDPMTITVGSLPTDGKVGYVDGGGFNEVSAGQTLTSTQLQSLYYKPDGDATYNPDGSPASGAEDVTFTYTVESGPETLTGTVNLHTLYGTGGYTDSVQIGDGHEPLTSGHDQTIAYTVSPEFANLTDYTQSSLELTTDFHTRSDKVLSSELENQVSVRLDIDGNVFTVVDAGDSAVTWSKIADANGTYDSDSGAHWSLEVLFTDIKGNVDLNNDGIAEEVSLSEYLAANPQTAGVNQWTLVYDDNTGGNEQARYLKGDFILDVDADSAVYTDGTGTDLIYGSTSGGDELNGSAGNDIIIGREGNDFLTGGEGDDIMTGGAGADTFKVGAGEDTITDFTVGTDKLVIEPAHTEVIFEHTTGSTTVQLTINGSSGPVGSVLLEGMNDTSATDLLNSLIADGENVIS